MSDITTNQIQNDSSWAALVQRNLPLVKYVLGKMSRNIPPSVDRDDLIAVGSIGLIEAAKRFEPKRNVPFHSYAIPRIWGAMLDELRRHDWLSTGTRDQINRLQQRIGDMKQAGNLSPAVEDLAKHMGCSAERIRRLLSIAGAKKQRHSSDFVAKSAVDSLYSRLGMHPSRDPYQLAEFNDQKQLLAKAIDALPEREKRVIVLRYSKELCLHEIGDLLGVSESRVCQIHNEAVRRLRKTLKNTGISALH